MSDSLDRLPERSIERSLQEAQQQAAEMKASQRLGSSSVLTARVRSAASQDVTLVGPSNYKLHIVQVEFIPSDRTFGGSFAYRLNARFTNGSGTVLRLPLRSERRRTVDGRQRWYVYYETFGTSPMSIKFYIFATGSGQIAVNVLT